MMGPIYAITDPDAPLGVVAQAHAAARGGAWAVQLRDKRACDAEMTDIAREIRDVLRPFGARLIINDRLEVARASDADGLHIGQGDGDPEDARAALGPGKLLGLSIEARSQCAAIPACVDYIGVGPVRATATKPDHAPPLGMGGLAAIIAEARVPAFAIGGITARDARALKGAGAIGMAVVSAISRAPDPEAATKALCDAWRQA